MDKRTKKECQSMVKRALSMPEPAQTIALREVFDKAVAPAIITTVSKTFRPAMLRSTLYCWSKNTARN